MALLALLVLFPPAAHPQNSRAQSEATLRQLEHSLAEDAVRLDIRLWDQVVAPDWTMIDPAGRQVDKQTVLALYKKAKAAAASSQVVSS
ncbi:MAG TPA: hypothetical protein VJW55_20850 [Candidatus Angelobacter sp.]|nr:hypothetical protein [Candidatus Angelobacter sp.]